MSVKKLNHDQEDAVSYTQNPLLILAGPGSGKTLTITEKVIKLVKSGISAEKILSLTFSYLYKLIITIFSYTTMELFILQLIRLNINILI